MNKEAKIDEAAKNLARVVRDAYGSNGTVCTVILNRPTGDANERLEMTLHGNSDKFNTTVQAAIAKALHSTATEISHERNEF